MVYTPEEKKKMDNLLAVFADYVAGHTEFDVAYSDKTGYVRLIIDENAEQYFFPIADFDDLLDMFCMEIVCEEVDLLLSKDPSLCNQDVDYDMIRLRLQEYIDRMEEAYRPQAAQVVNRHILKSAMSPYIP